jgi:hypothetical protein
MKDSAARARIIATLERTYAISLQPTGFHLISAIADVIEGNAAWREPSLIVVDAILPGCAGTTIADGLRDLGIAIPTFVMRGPADVETFLRRYDQLVALDLEDRGRSRDLGVGAH